METTKDVSRHGGFPHKSTLMATKVLCNVTYTTEEDGTIAPYKELGRSLCFYCERLFTA